MRIGKWSLVAVAAAAAVAAVVGVVQRKSRRKAFKLATEPEVARAREILALLYPLNEDEVVDYVTNDVELTTALDGLAAMLAECRKSDSDVTVKAFILALEKVGDIVPDALLVQLDANTQKAVLHEGYDLGKLSVWAGRWWHLNQDSPDMAEFDRALAARIK